MINNVRNSDGAFRHLTLSTYLIQYATVQRWLQSFCFGMICLRDERIHFDVLSYFTVSSMHSLLRKPILFGIITAKNGLEMKFIMEKILIFWLNTSIDIPHKYLYSFRFHCKLNGLLEPWVYEFPYYTLEGRKLMIIFICTSERIVWLMPLLEFNMVDVNDLMFCSSLY